MRDAVDSAEKIRLWEDHMWNKKQLEEKLETSLDAGLTD